MPPCFPRVRQKGPLILIFCTLLIWTAGKSQSASTAREKKATEIGESLKNAELRQCFEQKRLISGFSSPNLVAEPPSDQRKWCLRAFTDRNASHTKDLIDHSSWVEFTWYRVDHVETKNDRSVPVPCVYGHSKSDATSLTVPRCRDVRPSCTVSYDGYRGEYRLSPDFGGYPKCSPTIEQYFFKLHNKTSEIARLPLSNPNSRQRYEAPSKRGCPLKRLPFSLDDFQMCTMSSNAWYVLEFRSYARWETDNGTLVEAMGKESVQLLRTFEAHDDIYLTHTQVTGCLLKAIFLLRHKLPFLLRLKIDIHVKNDANAVRQVHEQDRHDVGTDLVGKEFTYQLPPGTRTVRYCQTTEAILDQDPDTIMALPSDIHSCVARAVANCPSEETSSVTRLIDAPLMVVFCIAVSVLSVW